MDIFCTILLEGGKVYEIDNDELEYYRAAFPGVDVEKELRKLKAWNYCNPDRRKTVRGIRRHIFNWLSRADDGKQRELGYGSYRGRNKVQRYWDRLKEKYKEIE